MQPSNTTPASEQHVFTLKSYVFRSSAARAPERCSAQASGEDAVRYYKELSKVERAFRRWKSVDLKVRPIPHRLENRVRAHVFLCMLAYSVEWRMRRSLAPILFDDADPAAAGALRSSVVAPAQRSLQAQQFTAFTLCSKTCAPSR